VRPRAVILGGASPLRAAHRLGAECVYVSPGPVPEWKRAVADRVIDLDFTRTDELCRVLGALHAERPVRCVLSMTERGLLPAAVAGRHLGLPGTAVETVARLRDKAAMRTCLADSRHAVPAVTGRSSADVLAFGAAHGYPCVVKPVDGSGSLGVVRVDRPQDAAAAAAAQRGAAFLVEAFLAGPEYSVETLSAGGCHQVVAITEKFVLAGFVPAGFVPAGFVSAGFVEVGHVVPARVPAPVAATLSAAAVELLYRVGLRDGAAHTEVVLTAAGPRVVESHNRVGGDRINELVRIATGVDLVAGAVELALHGVAPAAAGAPARRAAAIRFLTPRPGRVRSIEGLDEVRAHPDVVEVEVAVEVGDQVPPLRQSADRAGFVLVAAPTADAAVATSAELAGRIVIGMEGGA